MANLFGCLLGIFLSFGAVVLFLVFNIIRKARNIMSGFSSRKTGSQTSGGHSTQGQERRTSSSASHSSKKLFDDDEGEYVDFEEIK